MQLLHTTKCCCCADLRMGGIILGVLGALGALGNLKYGAAGIVPLLIGGLVYGSQLYGIFSKKSDFLLPSVVFHIIGLCLWLIGVVVVLILFFAASDKLAEVMNEAFGVKGEVTFGVACLFMIGLALAAVLTWHFTSVVYSLWKNMKEGARPNAMYGA